MFNQRYDQPFYVNYEMARRMGYDRPFYLPPIELPEEKEPLPITPPEHKLFDRLQQLEGRFIHSENKYNKHLDKSKAEAYKKKKQYKEYE